jgi:hypothetical protein
MDRDMFDEFIRILESEVLDLPVNYPNNEVQYFPDFIHKKFEKYLDLLEITFHKEILEEITIPIKNSVEDIRKIINYYFSGQLPLSYTDFTKFFSANNERLDQNRDFGIILRKLLHETHRPRSEYKYKMKDVYRGRRSENSLHSIRSKEQLYHPPFEKRYILKNERYSITGYPCLYLGESAYICWAELRRPDFNDFVISRYRFRKDIFQFLDLSWRPISIAQLMRFIGVKNSRHEELNLKNLLINYLMLWPLLFMCSIKIKEKTENNQKFFPQYIFPQFLLQAVLSQDMSHTGIRYFSMEKEYVSGSNYTWNDLVTDSKSVNYVIPIEDVEPHGFSSNFLQEFIVSNPTSFQQSQILPDQTLNPSLFWLNQFQAKFETLPITSYSRTIFGKLEKNTYNLEDEFYDLRGKSVFLYDCGKIISKREFEILLSEKEMLSVNLREYSVHFIVANKSFNCKKFNLQMRTNCSVKKISDEEIEIKWKKDTPKVVRIYSERDFLVEILKIHLFQDEK